MENNLIIKNTSAETDKKLKQGLLKIDKELKNLGFHDLNKDPWQTTGNFKYNELDSNTVNILTFNDLGYLIKSLSKMKRVKNEYDFIVKELELDSPPVLIWYGNNIVNLIHDLTIRVKMVSNQNKITSLQKAKQDLSSFLSHEDRLISTLENISKLLK